MLSAYDFGSHSPSYNLRGIEQGDKLIKSKFVFAKTGQISPQITQLELAIERQPELDRNSAKGGRSFYFFDFDDNLAFLSTPIYIFHKPTGKEIPLSSREWAEVHPQVGKPGVYADYEIRLCDKTGSFRNFRDRDISMLERLMGRRQVFIEDLANALGLPDVQWKGPSWSCFYHAVFNHRPVSVITARGHHPETLKSGIRVLVEKGHLPHEPNYLSLFPVSHPEVRIQLLMDREGTVPELKKAAIRASVEEALKVYGYNPYHRFGMSDDDPKNVELILEEMAFLKRSYPELSFFVISTHQGQFVKREVFSDHTADHVFTQAEQLALF